jgi:hypothetical protein
MAMWFFVSALESLLLMLATYRRMPDVAVFMAGWFVLSLAMGVADRWDVFPTLSTVQSRVNTFGMVVFPVVITAWMAAEREGWIHHAGTPNRIQHLMWSASMVSLLLPVFARWWGSVHRLERIVMTVGVVMLLGTFIEVFEYRAFSPQWADQPWKGLWAWRDRTLDMTMNMIGSFVVALLVTAKPLVSAQPKELNIQS